MTYLQSNIINISGWWWRWRCGNLLPYPIIAAILTLRFRLRLLLLGFLRYWLLFFIGFGLLSLGFLWLGLFVETGACGTVVGRLVGRSTALLAVGHGHLDRRLVAVVVISFILAGKHGQQEIYRCGYNGCDDYANDYLPITGAFGWL